MACGIAACGLSCCLCCQSQTWVPVCLLLIYNRLMGKQQNTAAQEVGPCCPCRQPRSSWLLVSAWPSPGHCAFWGVSSQVDNLCLVLSYPLLSLSSLWYSAFQISTYVSKKRHNAENSMMLLDLTNCSPFVSISRPRAIPGWLRQYPGSFAAQCNQEAAGGSERRGLCSKM